MSFTMPYSKLYTFTELGAYDVKFISVDRQKLDLSVYKLYILNKSENAAPELFAIYIQNYANQECKKKVFCNVQILG